MRGLRGRLLLAGWALLAATVVVPACSSNGPATAYSTGGGPGVAPRVITIGTLYASVGQFAGSSQAQFAGLQFWVKTVNASGGVYVKAFGKKIPVKVIAYDDQSKTSLAAQEYTTLITVDHVTLTVSDFGSVLTSVGVPVAQQNSAFMLDPTATTPTFFTESIFGNGNPDLVLTSLPSSAIWPLPLASFLVAEGVRRIAIVQSANDYDAAQASTVEQSLSSDGIVPVYNATVQTSTTDYSSVVSEIRAASPDAVLEFGYSSNDVPFLSALDSSGFRPKLTFTIFPGENLPAFEAKLPTSALEWTYTYVAPPYLVQNQVNFGMTTPEFVNAFQGANPGVQVGFLNIAGYQAGLIAQATLAASPSLSPFALRAASQSLSGHLQTLEGTFALDRNGSQIGLYQPIGQIVPGGSGGLTLDAVYPPKYATETATYPAPAPSSPAARP